MALVTDDPAPVLKLLGDKLSTKALDPRSFAFSVLGSNPTVPEPACYTYKAPHYVSWYLMGTSNEIDFTHFPNMAKECFSEEKWDKPQDVRKQYDPNKRFATYLDA